MSKENGYENGCDSDGKIGPFFEAVMDDNATYSSYIESTDNFTAEALTVPLPAYPIPTLTTTKKRTIEASTAPLPAEPTPTPATTEK